MTEEFINQVAALSVFEERFAFVRNNTLKGNAAIYLRYIVLQINISEELEDDPLAYSIYRDIIVHTASIIESILEYTIREYITVGKAEEGAFGFNWHYSQISPIDHDCNEFHDAKFIVAKKEKVLKTAARDLSFEDINSTAKRLKILDDNLYKKADSLRAKRNLIHLTSLEKSSDDYFNKNDVQKAIANAHDIILRVESVLKGLNYDTE